MPVKRLWSKSEKGEVDQTPKSRWYGTRREVICKVYKSQVRTVAERSGNWTSEKVKAHFDICQVWDGLQVFVLVNSFGHPKQHIDFRLGGSNCTPNSRVRGLSAK